MSMVRTLQYLPVLVLTAAIPASAEELHLVCLGGGSYATTTNSAVALHDNWGGSAYGTMASASATGYEDAVAIDLTDSSGVIRLPRVLLPIVHGGKGGWFDLKNLNVSEREITASAAVNFMNKPRVRLDRYSGTVSIDGKNGTFVAQCRKVEASQPRAF